MGKHESAVDINSKMKKHEMVNEQGLVDLSESYFLSERQHYTNIPSTILRGLYLQKISGKEDNSEAKSVLHSMEKGDLIFQDTGLVKAYTKSSFNCSFDWYIGTANNALFGMYLVSIGENKRAERLLELMIEKKMINNEGKIKEYQASFSDDIPSTFACASSRLFLQSVGETKFADKVLVYMKNEEMIKDNGIIHLDRLSADCYPSKLDRSILANCLQGLSYKHDGYKVFTN